MKIIAGKHRGRKLESPKGKEIRPTASMARESLFNLLMHLNPNPVVDQHVADLFCGTGALGLEALSRGAAHVTFVDENRKSLELAKDNAELLSETGNSQFIHSSSVELPQAKEPYALVMMDPPYRTGLAVAAWSSLVKKKWIAQGSMVAIEMDHKEEVPSFDGAEIIKDRIYGKTRIIIVEML